MLKFFRDLLGAEADQSALAQTAPTELATVMIELLVEAAKADGGLAEEEQQLISQIMAHHFEISADEIAPLFDEALQAAQERVDLHSLTRRLRALTDYEERLAMLELVWLVVLADDHLDHLEASTMRRLAGLLYIEDVDAGKAAKAARALIADGAYSTSSSDV